jgi:hypothetical protein
MAAHCVNEWYWAQEQWQLIMVAIGGFRRKSTVWPNTFATELHVQLIGNQRTFYCYLAAQMFAAIRYSLIIVVSRQYISLDIGPPSQKCRDIKERGSRFGVKKECETLTLGHKIGDLFKLG